MFGIRVNMKSWGFFCFFCFLVVEWLGTVCWCLGDNLLRCCFYHWQRSLAFTRLSLLVFCSVVCEGSDWAICSLVSSENVLEVESILEFQGLYLFVSLLLIWGSSLQAQGWQVNPPIVITAGVRGSIHTRSIKLLKSLHIPQTSPRSQWNTSHITPPIKISKGTIQGDTLDPYLFIIFLEPLL